MDQLNQVFITNIIHRIHLLIIAHAPACAPHLRGVSEDAVQITESAESEEETIRRYERQPDTWILQLTSIDHQITQEEIEDLGEARQQLIERVDEWVLKAHICSKRNPRRVIYYYYAGLLHNLDRRENPYPDMEDVRNIPQ